MDVLLEKSLINSHCTGMDSLVLKDGPGMVRMFIARADHQLYRNNPAYGNSVHMSVALHRHHSDVTLQPILGDVYNVGVSNRFREDSVAKFLKSYKFTSHILHGDKAGFSPVDDLGKGIPVPLLVERISTPRYMPAQELHSIYVPQGQIAAWYVWEGKESPNHNGIVYTDDPRITEIDFSQYDLPMTEDRLREDLNIVGVRNAR